MTHYFESPSGPSGPLGSVEIHVGSRRLVLATAAGVFARDGLDKGTAVLLDEAPAPPQTGDLLDLGCGYGPIALTLAVRSPKATVWAVDVNERARELCAADAEAAGLTNVRVSETVPEGIRFAAIWSNPPIRIGKQALHALLLEWLPRLDAGGAAVLVVQKNLGSDSLQRWLVEQGYPTERLTSRHAFRVLRLVSDHASTDDDRLR